MRSQVDSTQIKYRQEGGKERMKCKNCYGKKQTLEIDNECFCVLCLEEIKWKGEKDGI